MTESKFRAIIVGGGPTGMYMAKALSMANIDFVLLERGPPTFLQRGNQILIWPHSSRLFRQVGIYDELLERSYSLTDKVDLNRDGTVIGEFPTWEFLEKEHGYPFMAVARADLVEILYRSIPNVKERVRTQAKITEIKESDDGVQVILSDGTTERGSVIIGADGAHSQVRKYIESISTKAPSKKAYSVPFEANFYGVYGTGTDLQGLIGSKTFYEMRDTNRAIQLAAEDFSDRFFFALYLKMPEPSEKPLKHDEGKMEEIAAEFADVCAVPGVKFGDIWAKNVDKKTARVVHQTEGFAETWSAGRAIVIGDAAVVMTGVNALGMSNGIHSAALLANELHRISSTAKGAVTSGVVTDAFSRLRKFRAKQLTDVHRAAMFETRVITWATWWNWLFDRFIRRWMPDGGMMADSVHTLIQNGQILGYVPFDDIPAKRPYRRNPDDVKA